MTLSPCTPIVPDGGPDLSAWRRNRLSTIRAYPALRRHTRTNVIHRSIGTKGRVPEDDERRRRSTTPKELSFDAALRKRKT